LLSIDGSFGAASTVKLNEPGKTFALFDLNLIFFLGFNEFMRKKSTQLSVFETVSVWAMILSIMIVISRKVIKAIFLC